MKKVRIPQTGKSGQTAKLLSLVATKFNSPEEVASHVRCVSEGFEPWERDVVEQFMQQRGRLLDVGCGAGREAIAFAELGFEVVGIDLAEKMIERARTLAVERGVKVEFYVGSVTECEFPPESFDYVFFSRAVYSYLPRRELRLATLARLHRMLKPTGLLLVSGYFVARRRLFRRRTMVDFYRTIMGKVIGRWMTYEPGDTFVGQVSESSDRRKPCFLHLFPSLAAIGEELREASFSVISDGTSFYFVATPADGAVRLVESAEFEGLATELLCQGLCVRFTVTGTSMRPLLEDGEVVTLAPVNPHELKIGDLALVRRPSQSLTLHRLVRRTEAGLLVFKGDAINKYDEPVGTDHVIGRVIEIEKKDRRIRLYGPVRSLINRVSAKQSIVRAACSRAIHRWRAT